jgi:hypothetical protein
MTNDDIRRQKRLNEMVIKPNGVAVCYASELPVIHKWSEDDWLNAMIDIFLLTR